MSRSLCTFVRMAGLLVSTAIATSLFSPAYAQSYSSDLPPLRTTLDENGVDLATGTLNLAYANLSVGDQVGGLSFARVLRNSGFRDAITGTMTTSGSVVTISIGATSESFNQSGNTYTSREGTGSTLGTDASGTLIYTTSDGIKRAFMRVPVNNGSTGVAYNGFSASAGMSLLSKVTKPDGTVTSYVYDIKKIFMASTPGGPIYYDFVRPRSLTSSGGYRMEFAYQRESVTTSGDFSQGFWLKSIKTFNVKTDCGATATSCSTTAVRPSLSISDFGVAPVVYTDGTGAATNISTNGNAVTLRSPGSASNDFVTTVDANGRVTQVTSQGVVTNYTYADSGTIRTVTAAKAGGQPRTLTFEISSGVVLTDSDELNRKTTYTYTASKQLQQVAYPEGNTISYSRDARNNALSTTITAPANLGGGTITSSATFVSACTNVVTCNLPITTTDPLNRVTNYAYDPTHGGVTSVTAPAGANGVRPEVRYTYSTFTGALGSDTLYRLTAVSTCQTTASCTGSADETKQTIGYDPSNILPVTQTQSAGDGSVSATTTLAYDAVGNVASVDGPLVGVGDTTNYAYDAARRPISVVGADPDGGGPLNRRAKVYHYLPGGQVDSVSVGTTDANGGSFQSLQQLTMTFDGNLRKVKEVLTAGGTTYAVSGYGYDASGRLICSASRIDPAQWNGQTDNCSPQTNGPNGPDRVQQRGYDAASQLTTVVNAFGTPEATTEQTSYTPNGKIATVTDGNGNVTSYGYDGFGRSQTTTFPGGGYEQSGYDANGNVTSRRLRDGQVLTYDYDALNRRTYDHNPRTNVAEVDVSYSYNNLGRLLNAGDGNGWTKTFAYDALGRATRQGSNVSNTTFQYDTAGRTTRQTWGDGFYVTYEYDTAGEMTVIRENGSLALATFSYDDLGRRTALTRGNGTVTSYGYDAASRLTSLSQDLAATARDQNYTFSYNPAGQIAARTASNDAYAWNGAVNLDRSYAVNGLNQYTSAGSTSFGYDGRGNLTNSGGTTYQYNTRNQLFMNATGQLIYRNPAGELGQTPGTNYDWVNGQLAQESASSVQRRYVYGPGADEVLVWYEGTGTADRRYLHADERGSVVAVSDGAGNALAVNSYDEYGIPGANNQGRFQYTGQVWLPELGMYDYKARMYSPTIGRFMQTDPIGYGDGLNWYNYVGSDPINSKDPTGTYSFQQCNPNLNIPTRINGTEVIVSAPTQTCFNVYLPDVNLAPPAGGQSPPAGVGGGSGTPATPQNRDNDKSCERALDLGGAVVAQSLNFSAIPGAGMQYTRGTFQSANGKVSGSFRTIGAGVGFDVGVGATLFQYYGSLQNFVGQSFNISGQIGVGSLSASFSRALDFTGGSASAGSPGKAFSLTASRTRIFGCKYAK